MDLTLIAAILFVVSLPLVMLVLLLGSRLFADRLIGGKHRLIQSITETGQVPPGWRGRFERRAAQAGGDAARVAQVRHEARLAYLEKLDGLIRYVQHSQLVDGEETRQILLDKLAEVREAWATSEEALR